MIFDVFLEIEQSFSTEEMALTKVWGWGPPAVTGRPG